MATPSIPNDFVLSTTCFGDRLEAIEDQIFAAVAMGFRNIELGLAEAPVTMDGLCEARSETGSQVTSMVAGCRDGKRGELIARKLTSPDGDERERALNSLRRHMRLAETWNCPRIIVRGSRVADGELERRAADLEARVDAGPLDDDLREEVRGLAAEVQKRGQKQVEHLCRGLHSLVKELPGARFCLEPGERLDDLLGLEAMGWILEDLPSLSYWHDVGQIHQRERRGLPSQGAWLDRFGARIGGLHLQDATSRENELPIGAGQVDFKLVAEYAPKHVPRVLEIAAKHGRAEVVGSVQSLIDLGF